LPFEVLNDKKTTSVLVTDDEILAARNYLWEEFRIAVEPAAAAPLAAWSNTRARDELSSIILCGANTDWLPND
jgi:threonine dehydratase